MKTLPVDENRGLWGGVGLVCIALGSAVLWGIGGALLSWGVVCLFCVTLDEALECITGVQRAAPFLSPPSSDLSA